MTVAWFEDPKQLFDEKKLLSFWPTSKQDAAERVNSTTRFILYVSAVLYALHKDSRILLLAMFSVGILYCFYKSEMISKPVEGESTSEGYAVQKCEAPSVENPMANVLMSDYTEFPDRPSACYYPKVQKQVMNFLDDSFAKDVNDLYGKRNMAANRMYSMPATTIPNDQTAFAEAAYGKKFRPMCRDDSSFCNADNNPRHPEQVQIQAISGAGI
tara:strand:+ start:2597 stop:3238 length:642 start_codon:yes stop_codon:yes gene_type:complete